MWGKICLNLHNFTDEELEISSDFKIVSQSMLSGSWQVRILKTGGTQTKLVFSLGRRERMAFE